MAKTKVNHRMKRTGTIGRCVFASGIEIPSIKATPLMATLIVVILLIVIIFGYYGKE